MKSKYIISDIIFVVCLLVLYLSEWVNIHGKVRIIICVASTCGLTVTFVISVAQIIRNVGNTLDISRKASTNLHRVIGVIALIIFGGVLLAVKGNGM